MTTAIYERLKKDFFIIAGPCVLESYELALDTAFAVKEAAEKHGVFAIFKSSFDKANRTSINSFRGPGMAQGLEWLSRISEATGLPVITDIHEPDQAAPVAEVASILQIPAFLCRQTSLLQAAGQTKAIVNIKKGQFVAPWDMGPTVNKVREVGNNKIMLTERGSSFGYNNLVVDFRSFAIMSQLNVPIVFDATHAVQLPGGQGECSGGNREYVPMLARAAIAAGANGLFTECHPDPDKALCDGPNSLQIDSLEPLLGQLVKIREICHENRG